MCWISRNCQEKLTFLNRLLKQVLHYFPKLDLKKVVHSKKRKKKHLRKRLLENCEKNQKKLKNRKNLANSLERNTHYWRKLLINMEAKKVIDCMKFLKNRNYMTNVWCWLCNWKQNLQMMKQLQPYKVLCCYLRKHFWTHHNKKEFSRHLIEQLDILILLKK